MFQIEKLAKEDVWPAYNILFQELYGEILPNNYFPEEVDLECEIVLSCKKDGNLIALCFLFFDGTECRFGFFESKNDQNAIRCLMDYVHGFARSQGADKVIGPVNKTTWNNYRWAVSGSFPRFFTEAPQRDYYPTLLRGSSFEELKHYESRIEMFPVPERPERLERIQARLNTAGIKIRNLDMAKFNQEIGAIHEFVCNQFRDQEYFQEIDKAVFINKYKKLKSVIQSEYVFLAEDESGNLYGLLFALPNFYDPGSIVIKTIACQSGRKASGCIHLMRSQLIDLFEEKGKQLKYIIHAFMRVDNSSRNISNGYDSEVLRSYSLFSKLIA